MIPVNAPNDECEIDCGCGLSSDDIASLMNGKAIRDTDWRQVITSPQQVCRTCGELHRHNFKRQRITAGV